MLNGNLRTLSMLRDGYFETSTASPAIDEEHVAFLNQLNTNWVKAMKRLSPRLLIHWLQDSGKEYCDFLRTLAPNAPATFAVAWVGQLRQIGFILLETASETPNLPWSFPIIWLGVFYQRS